jgi:uncharacterized protein YjcR
MKANNRTLTKLEIHNLKQMFRRDFTSGKYSIEGLTRKYGVNRLKLLKWKKELFGKGSLKRKRMYQMHLSEIPTRVIAEFYNVSTVQVNFSIREQKKKQIPPKEAF